MILQTTPNPTNISFRKLKWGGSIAKEYLRGLEEGFAVGWQPAPIHTEGRECPGLTIGTTSLAETTELRKLEIQGHF